MTEKQTEVQILLSLHQNLRANQDFYMNQKWKTIYLLFVIYAGLYSILITYKQGFIVPTIVVLLTLTYGTGAMMLCIHEIALKGEREADKLFKINPLIKDTYELMYKASASGKSFFIYLVFQCANLIGFIFVLALVGCYQPNC
jgi:hypothetical protein